MGDGYERIGAIPWEFFFHGASKFSRQEKRPFTDAVLVILLGTAARHCGTFAQDSVLTQRALPGRDAARAGFSLSGVYLFTPSCICHFTCSFPLL